MLMDVDTDIGKIFIHLTTVELHFEIYDAFQIEWSDIGEAMFHDICWKAVLDSLRMDNPFCFSSLEKAVIEEAKQTAEYFDSAEKLDMEAGRIVEMLKSAEHAIAFTGMIMFCCSQTHVSPDRGKFRIFNI